MVKWFEKFSLNFSISLFVIRANLLHPCSVMVNIIISSLFSYISRVLFSGFLRYKSNFFDGQNNSKYRDVAPFNRRLKPEGLN